MQTRGNSRATLESHRWSDLELKRIPTEALAEFAYQQSDTLAQEFQSCSVFLAYWRASRHGAVHIVSDQGK